MRDSHLDVVEYDRKVVKRMTVRTQEDEILNFGVRALLFVVDDVRESRRAFTCDFQANRERFAGSRAPVGFFRC